MEEWEMGMWQGDKGSLCSLCESTVETIFSLASHIEYSGFDGFYTYSKERLYHWFHISSDPVWHLNMGTCRSLFEDIYWSKSLETIRSSSLAVITWFNVMVQQIISYLTPETKLEWENFCLNPNETLMYNLIGFWIRNKKNPGTKQAMHSRVQSE